jgi:regulator of sigma E protease
LSEILSHPIPAVVVLLGLLVFVHEFGHYIVGRLLGIAVEVFSIGFGPPIIAWTRRGVSYRLSWIPLGGYVKFAGAHPSEDLPQEMHGIAYRDASLWARGLTIAAGPLANFALAAIVFAILGGYGIPHPPPLVGEVIDGSRAEMAGMRPGDLIVEINGVAIKKWRELEQKISESPEKKLNLKIQRQEGLSQKEISLVLTPAEVSGPNWMGGQKDQKIGRAGIALGQLPSIVTIKDSQSFAAQAGLATGDQVVAIGLPEGSVEIQGIQNSQPRQIKSFWALRETLRTLVQEQRAQPEVPLKVVLKVRRTDPVSLSSSPNPSQQSLAEVRDVVFDLSTAAFGNGSKDGLLSSREVLDTLGIEDSQLTLGQIPEGYQAFEPGDVVLRFGETSVSNIYQLREALLAHQDPEGEFTVLRHGEEKTFKVPMEPVEVQKMEGKAIHYAFPVGFWVQLTEPEPFVEKYSWGEAVGFGLMETLRQAQEMTINVGQLITGQIPMKALGGPMLIAKVAGDSAKRGWQTFLGALALISINLGVLNLFPIPVLDGGQLVMIAWEAVRRRPVGELALENYQKIGFAMILALVVLATYNDLSRFWISMLSSVVGIFK